MMNRVEMNDEMMMQVNGGIETGKYKIDPSQEKDYFNEIHPGCGGHIENNGNPFAKCKCNKCGETKYWYSDFFKKIETIKW